MEPVFRKAADGSLNLQDSAEATKVRGEKRSKDWSPALSPGVVRSEAIALLQRSGGDVNNSKHLLGCFKIQFGQFR